MERRTRRAARQPERNCLQNVEKEKQEPEEELQGTSLFHQCMSLRRLTHSEEDMKFLLHRLIVIAALPQSLADRQKLGAHYEELNVRLQRQYHVEGISGLLLMYPSCLLHVIESSSEVLVSLLQNLKDLQEEGRQVETAKVVLMSHDLPNRLFHQWSYKVLTMQTRTLGEEAEGESTDALVDTVRSMILKLGTHLEIASEALPGSVLEEAPELVVPQEVLIRLLACPELLSPQQYLQTYHSPLNICMDSGHVFGSSCATTV
ncbi:testis-expressed protein 47 isoform X1 [Gadus morhua]|uniref:testis-expressed protein 47 isoform X1 n=1 Tax=Gadus morhua TaxID=8049 RepID=UPI0011B7AD22|nr:testis-expressed protein 47 isoform X1 [Gadus morhua]XP_030196141.1 testis-expressed protein 47 isoform X1 [Gadus morhua]